MLWNNACKRRCSLQNDNDWLRMDGGVWLPTWCSLQINNDWLRLNEIKPRLANLAEMMTGAVSCVALSL